MFNNANVLYKTRFVDGVSTVARYEQLKSGNTFISKKSEKERKNDKKPAGPGSLFN